MRKSQGTCPAWTSQAAAEGPLALPSANSEYSDHPIHIPFFASCPTALLPQALPEMLPSLVLSFLFTWEMGEDLDQGQGDHHTSPALMQLSVGNHPWASPCVFYWEFESTPPVFPLPAITCGNSPTPYTKALPPHPQPHLPFSHPDSYV
jgi:hypothetical protein